MPRGARGVYRSGPALFFAPPSRAAASPRRCPRDDCLHGTRARYPAAGPRRRASGDYSPQGTAKRTSQVSLARVSVLEKDARLKLEAARDENDADADAAARLVAEGRLMLGVFERRVGYFYFRDELELDDATLDRLLATCGPVMSQTRATLARKGESLQKHLELDDRSLRKLVRVQPTLLGHDDAKLAEKIRWLQNALGLENPCDLGKACGARAAWKQWLCLRGAARPADYPRDTRGVAATRPTE